MARLRLSDIPPPPPRPPADATDHELVTYLMLRAGRADAEHKVILQRIRNDRWMHLAAYILIVCLAAYVVQSLHNQTSDLRDQQTALRSEGARAIYGECLSIKANADTLRTILDIQVAAQVANGTPLSAQQQATLDAILAQIPNPHCVRPKGVPKPPPAPTPALKPSS